MVGTENTHAINIIETKLYSDIKDNSNFVTGYVNVTVTMNSTMLFKKWQS